MEIPPPSAAGLAVRVLNRRRTILRVAFSLAAITGLVTLLQPRTYAVQSIVLPISAEAATSRLAGLAAQFGIPAFGGTAGQTPEFYAAYLESKELRGRIVDTRLNYADREGFWRRGEPIEVSSTLTEVLELEDEGPRGRELAIQELASFTAVSIDRVAGTVSILVRTRSPGLSVALSNAFLTALDDFNQTQRQSQAGAERAFVEKRLEEAREQLRMSEDSLQRFLQENRSFTESPQLVFVQDRLRRSVALRQQIVGSLAETHEKARIDEVRDTPVLTVVQSPAPPGVADRRRLVMKTSIAFLAGIAVATVVVVLIGAFGSASGEDPEARRSIRRAFEEIRAELRRPWRLLW